MSSSVTKEVVKRLALYLKAQMTDLAQVLEDFPEANQALNYPCLSVMTGTPKHLPRAPQFVSSVAGTSPALTSKYVVGDYEWSLQLDLWCSSKEERHALYEKFYNAFNSQWPTMGLSLTLSEYHGEICRYDLSDYKFDDSEAGSQRKEWRTKIVVLANCQAIKTHDEFAVITTELTTEVYDISENVEGL